MQATTTSKESHQPIQITDANFEAEVLESHQPVLIDFWADWCGPCHVLAPTIQELAGQYEGSVKVGKLDLDENPESARAYGIQSIPFVLILKDGKVVDSIIGVHPKDRYTEALEQLISAECGEEMPGDGQPSDEYGSPL